MDLPVMLCIVNRALYLIVRLNVIPIRVGLSTVYILFGLYSRT